MSKQEEPQLNTNTFSMILQISFLLSFVLLSTNADGTDKSEKDLRRALFADYDKLVRPVRKTTDSVPVFVNLLPTALRDVDVKDREIKFDSWIFLKWEDHSLTWDPSEYGINHFVQPADTVWKPDITLYSAVSDSNYVPPVMTNVYIYSNGTVLWVPPFTVKNRCPPTENQITEDTFQCTVSLGSWTYDVEQLNLHNLNDNPLTEVRDEFFHNVHPKWVVESMTATTEQKKYACCDERYSVVRYDIRLRKRPSHHSGDSHSGGDSGSH